MSRTMPSECEPAGASHLTQLLRRRASLIVAAALMIVLAPFVYSLVTAILWPGLAYCVDYPDCLSASPSDSINDLASIIIVVALNGLGLILLAIVIFSPGASMHHPRCYKLASLMGVVMLLCSTVLVVVPTLYRQRVLPLRSHTPYSIVVRQESASSATLLVSRLAYTTSPTSATAYRWFAQDDLSRRRLMVEVRHASGDERGAQQIDPLSHVLFSDQGSSYNDGTSQQGNFSRFLQGLQEGFWYSIVVSPARQALNGDAYTAHPLVSLDDTDDNADYIDLRAFALCRWASAGCSELKTG